MKKLLLSGLAVLLTLAMAACGTNSGDSTSSNPTSGSQTSSQSGDPSPEMITGTLYAVFGKNSVNEFDFGYEEGTCTPEKIAAALSEWTGLAFDITSDIDTAYNAVTVDWTSNSSFAEGQPPEPQKEGFEFYDQESMRWFMLNSLCRTIRKNMGNVDVFYSIEGDDLNDLGLDADFNPGIAYNRMDSSNVAVN